MAKRGPYGPYTPEETRSKLLKVALELFGERGFQATSVSLIAQRAGVTKGAFYHHFDSKDDLLRQIHFEYASRVLVSVRQIAESDLNPLAQLRAVIKGVVYTFAEYRSHVAIFYQEFRSLGGSAYASIRAMHDEEAELVTEMIKRGIEQGELDKKLIPKLLVFAISGITAWIYQWYDPKGTLSLDTIADGLADIILEGSMAREFSATVV